MGEAGKAIEVWEYLFEYLFSVLKGSIANVFLAILPSSTDYSWVFFVQKMFLLSYYLLFLPFHPYIAFLPYIIFLPLLIVF